MATKYDLLRARSINAGRMVAYDTLLGQTPSRRRTGEVNRVRNFVKKLRGKLGDDAQNPAWIFSVRGVGYRMPHPQRRLTGRATVGSKPVSLRRHATLYQVRLYSSQKDSPDNFH